MARSSRESGAQQRRLRPWMNAVVALAVIGLAVEPAASSVHAAAVNGQAAGQAAVAPCGCHAPGLPSTNAAEESITSLWSSHASPGTPAAAPVYRWRGELRWLCLCPYESASRRPARGDGGALSPAVQSGIDRVHASGLLAGLNPLLGAQPLRYFLVNLAAPCAFWPDEGMCTIRDCGVDSVDDATRARLQRLDRHGGATEARHIRWRSVIDAEWTDELEDEVGLGASVGQPGDRGGAEFVDLVANPERFTAYGGDHAQSIWREIYYNTDLLSHSPLDASDRPQHSDDEGEDLHRRAQTLAASARLLRRAVSGMHASVNVHLTAFYLLDETTNAWGVDLDAYEKRIGKDADAYLGNLVFVHQLLLRAVDVAADALLGYPFDDEQSRDRQGPAQRLRDGAAVSLVRGLLATRTRWLLHGSVSASLLADAGGQLPSDDAMLPLMDARSHVYNISRLMDCVGCDRCRLWGTVQVRGIGTALRLLFAPDRADVLRAMRRNQWVALLQTLGRFTHAIELARVLQPLYEHHAAAVRPP